MGRRDPARAASVPRLGQRRGELRHARYMAYRPRSGPPGPRRWSVLLRAPGFCPGWRLGSLGCRPSERGLLAVLDSGAELGMRAVAVLAAVHPVAVLLVLLVLLAGTGFPVSPGASVTALSLAGSAHSARTTTRAWRWSRDRSPVRWSWRRRAPQTRARRKRRRREG